MESTVGWCWMCEHQPTKYNKNHGGPLSGVPHSFDGLNTSGLRIFSVDDQPLHNYTIEMVCCVHTIFGFMDVEWHSRHVDFKCVKHIFGQLLTFHEQRSGTNGSTTNYFLLVIIPWLLAIQISLPIHLCRKYMPIVSCCIMYIKKKNTWLGAYSFTRHIPRFRNHTRDAPLASEYINPG